MNTEIAPQGVGSQIWAEEYFGPHGALARSKKHFRELIAKDKGVEACCSLASAYYSAATSEIPKVKRGNVSAFIRGLWCLRCAHLFARRVVRLYGFEKCTADQLDILQSIYRAVRHYSLAEKAINEGLRKCDPQTSGHVSLHTQLLLLVGRGMLYLHNGNKEAAKNIFLYVYPTVFKVGSQQQKSRILRHCSTYHKKVGNAEMARICFESALLCAQESSADQVEKNCTFNIGLSRRTQAGHTVVSRLFSFAQSHVIVIV